jgi:hypothetical protein
MTEGSKEEKCLQYTTIWSDYENDVIYVSVEKQCHATKYLQAKNPVENKIHQMCIFTI